MKLLPVMDRSGNELLAIDVVGEDELGSPHPDIALPLSLVVVMHAGRVLMIFNRWRQEWELPGGMIEPLETPRQAAYRELDEETGISAADLRFRARTTFSLKRPDRFEYAAVFSVVLDDLPELRVNAEASGFLWWSPSSQVEEDMSSLDASIALWSVATPPRGSTGGRGTA
jgi:8-oxo-dGTP diphosphatase